MLHENTKKFLLGIEVKLDTRANYGPSRTVEVARENWRAGMRKKDLTSIIVKTMTIRVNFTLLIRGLRREDELARTHILRRAPP